MNTGILRQLTTFLAFLAVVIINGLANALPLNGLTTGEISDRFQVFFVPAGYVFSIWGVIYLGLLAYSVYQALPAQRDNPRLQAIAGLFVLSCLANIAWLFLWHYEIFPLTIFAMVALLVLLIVIYLRLDIGRSQVSTAERWAVHLPFSIYLGWISVATIANATSLLDFLNWDGGGIDPQVWAVVMLVAGWAIATAMSLIRRDVAFSLVVIWAFIGIAVKQADAGLVAGAAWVLTVLVAVSLVVGLIRRQPPSLALPGQPA